MGTYAVHKSLNADKYFTKITGISDCIYYRLEQYDRCSHLPNEICNNNERILNAMYTWLFVILEGIDQEASRYGICVVFITVILHYLVQSKAP